MSTPGSGDPYFYEWYVGLSNVIEMLNPDSGIKSVTFQHADYNTVDDVVVEYTNGNKQFCYQIKHEKYTSNQTNLTFGKLIEKDSSKSNKASLIASVFTGWKSAVSSSGMIIIPILYTNREAGIRRSGRTFAGVKYSAYSIHDFFTKLKDELNKINDYKNVKFSDKDLELQWKEFYDSIKTTDVEKVISFVKALKIETNQPNLDDLEKVLITKLEKSFSCNTGIATELLVIIKAEKSSAQTLLIQLIVRIKKSFLFLENRDQARQA